MLRSALITIGGVFTIGGNVKFGHEIFLIIPWLTFILGWAYLINDEKISSIGYYIKTTLSKQLETTLSKDAVFQWEHFYKGKRYIKRKSKIQLLVDLTTFVFSGVAAVGTYWLISPPSPIWGMIICLIELGFLGILGTEICRQALLKR